MAVSTTHERVLYDLDGVTAGYSVTFQFFAAGDLSVTYGTTGDETTLSLGSDYTVAARPSDLPALGTITLASPGSLTGKLQIRRSTPRTQGLDLSASGPQDPEAYEDALDRAMLIAQELDQNDPPTGTDFVHGNLGGGALHAVATNSVNGFYAAADKVLNDAHRANVSNPHGVTYTQVGATPLAHASATTNVHGITDTADLLTITSAASTYLKKTVTYDEDVTQNLIAWTPDGDHAAVPHAAFAIQLGGSDFFGERDHVGAIGWNPSRLTGEPKLIDQWEDHYVTGGGATLWMERFIEYENPRPAG
jgi:hypothetical protein